MISQFFVLSPRGDTIINKDYRGDILKGTPEIFFRKVKSWKGEAPPIFNVDAINFIHVKKGGLYFVCTTKFNASPNLILELVMQLTRVFKDYCGVLSEESIRKNFVLIYELLEETMDYGYPQATSTEQLKAFIFNEAIAVEEPQQSAASKVGGLVNQMKNAGGKLGKLDLNPKTTPSTSVHKPITMGGDNKGRKNEIFVDILERISVMFNASGYILNSEIEGSIQMKSYLSGNPELRLALNEDLVIGRGANAGYGSVILDDCNFHEVVKLNDFDQDRTLFFFPPDGEFTVMNYRITGDFRAPFRIFPFIEEFGELRAELILKIRADIPEHNYGGSMVIKFPLPKNTANCSVETGVGVVGETAEYKASERSVSWNIKKFVGGTEKTLRAKISLSAPCHNIRKEIGPINLSFEIPMYNVSNLQVRYLRIMERSKSYNPYRWVRYVTQSSSYVCRL